MDNYDTYVIALLNGTKEGKLQWKLDSNESSRYQAYCLLKGDQRLTIVKYDIAEYDILGSEIINSHCRLTLYGGMGEVIGDIVEDDLSNESYLWRLYRVVERQVNKFDSSIEGFVEGLNRYEF